jgi:hypothetical protein
VWVGGDGVGGAEWGVGGGVVRKVIAWVGRGFGSVGGAREGCEQYQMWRACC